MCFHRYTFPWLCVWEGYLFYISSLTLQHAIFMLVAIYSGTKSLIQYHRWDYILVESIKQTAVVVMSRMKKQNYICIIQYNLRDCISLQSIKQSTIVIMNIQNYTVRTRSPRVVPVEKLSTTTSIAFYLKVTKCFIVHVAKCKYNEVFRHTCCKI